MSTNTETSLIVDWIAERSGRIFGMRITPTNQQDIFDATALSIEHKEQLIIAHQNLHGLYVELTEKAFSELHELPQTMVHIDGFPLVYLAWLNKLWHTRMEHRTAIHDWMPHFAKVASTNQWRIYCLGSSADVNQRAISALTELGPNAIIHGHDGYFDMTHGSADNNAVLADIAAFNPDIVIVGMGMPKQEQWLLENHEELGNRCLIAVGACLEYMAGEMSMSPRWFGPFGLEAVFRLVSHPRRYAHRYLIEPWLLLGLLLKEGRLFGRYGKA